MCDLSQATTFHLRADNERQRGLWIDALEQAKAPLRSLRIAHSRRVAEELRDGAAARAQRPSGARCTQQHHDGRPHVLRVRCGASLSARRRCAAEADEHYSGEESGAEPATSRVLSAKLSALQKSHAHLAKVSQQLKAKCEALSGGACMEPSACVRDVA